MRKTERVELLEEARECINEAIDKIQAAMKGTGEVERVSGYVIPSLKMCASENHGYFSKKPANIDELLRAIEEDGDLEEGD